MLIFANVFSLLTKFYWVLNVYIELSTCGKLLENESVKNKYLNFSELLKRAILRIPNVTDVKIEVSKYWKENTYKDASSKENRWPQFCGDLI